MVTIITFFTALWSLKQISYVSDIQQVPEYVPCSVTGRSSYFEPSLLLLLLLSLLHKCTLSENKRNPTYH
jgi:hypothetical protein